MVTDEAHDGAAGTSPKTNLAHERLKNNVKPGRGRAHASGTCRKGTRRMQSSVAAGSRKTGSADYRSWREPFAAAKNAPLVSQSTTASPSAAS